MIDKVSTLGSIVAGETDWKIDKIDWKLVKTYNIGSISNKTGKLGLTV